MSIYGGFGKREQEHKYNITLFDLVMSLSARVNGTLKNRSPEEMKKDSPEHKFLRHIAQLHRKL